MPSKTLPLDAVSAPAQGARPKFSVGDVVTTCPKRLARILALGATRALWDRRWRVKRVERHTAQDGTATTLLFLCDATKKESGPWDARDFVRVDAARGALPGETLFRPVSILDPHCPDALVSQQPKSAKQVGPLDKRSQAFRPGQLANDLKAKRTPAGVASKAFHQSAQISSTTLAAEASPISQRPQEALVGSMAPDHHPTQERAASEGAGAFPAGQSANAGQWKSFGESKGRQRLVCDCVFGHVEALDDGSDLRLIRLSVRGKNMHFGNAEALSKDLATAILLDAGEGIVFGLDLPNEGDEAGTGLHLYALVLGAKVAVCSLLQVMQQDLGALEFKEQLREVGERIDGKPSEAWPSMGFTKHLRQASWYLVKPVAPGLRAPPAGWPQRFYGAGVFTELARALNTPNRPVIPKSVSSAKRRGSYTAKNVSSCHCGCGRPLDQKNAHARFASSTCRVRAHRRAQRATPC